MAASFSACSPWLPCEGWKTKSPLLADEARVRGCKKGREAGGETESTKGTEVKRREREGETEYLSAGGVRATPSLSFVSAGCRQATY